MADPVGQCTGRGASAAWSRGGARVRSAVRWAHEPSLELRSVVRSWRAGSPGCAASVRALRGIDLVVRAGELVAIAGGAGAGKTTLLLCAAGIVRPDGGTVSGDLAGRVSYVGGDGAWMRQATDAIERGARGLLLDVLDAPGLASPRAVAALAGSAAAAGLAVLVVARDPAVLPAFATRLVTLAAGRVVASVEPLALLSRFVARRGRTA